MGYQVTLATAATQNEGQPGGTAARFTFNLTRDAGDNTETGYSYEIWQLDDNGQPLALANSDFAGVVVAITNGAIGAGTSADSNFTWTAGQNTLTISIDSALDTTVEPTEKFVVWFYREDAGHVRFNEVGVGINFTTASVITLTNDDIGPPVFSSAATFNAAENGTAVGTVVASAPNGAVTYALTGGVDGPGGGLDLFNINATTGVLTFKAAKNAEAPDDTGGDAIYNVQVTATSGGQSTVQNITVNLTNVNEAPAITSGGAAAINENSTAVIYTATGTTAPAGAEFGGSDFLTWSISGTDAAYFTINSSTGEIRATGTGRNFESPTDAGANNVYDLTVTATDSGGLTASQALAITVNDVVEGPVISSNGGGDFAFITVNENTLTTTALTTVVAVDQDPPGPPLPVVTYTRTGGADMAAFALDANTGVLTFVASPNFEAPTDANADNQYIVEVTATSAAGGTDVQTLYVTVANVIEAGVPSDVPPTGGGGGGQVPPPGNSGNDNVAGTNSSDSLAGGAGNDTISGGLGLDSIDGDDGNDLVFGGQNDDFIRGLNGDDIIYGDEGNDDVNGNQGQDLVDGGDGDDTVRGGQGNDEVYGGEGNDGHVNGNIGNDIVRGGNGNDTVYGGQNDDTLYGDAGDDRLSGDLGNDILYGNSGADRFVMLATGGVDWVADFNAAEGDRVQLATGQAYSVVNVSGQVYIQLTGGGAIGLAGVSFASFDSSWVMFGA